MKVAFFEAPEEEHGLFRSLLPGFDSIFFEEDFSEKKAYLATDVDILSVFINSKVNKEAIDQMPNLKLIVTRSMGFDHIDRAHCKSKGITISYVPRYGPRTIAEFSFALLLSLSRKIFDGVRQVKEGGEFSANGFKGFDLNEKTLGVVGVGNIGKNVIKIAKGFNMKVIACSHSIDEALAKELDFKYVDIDNLLVNSDIISIHVQLRDENNHMINKEKIAKMKKGVYIINTARGGVIDTEALVWGIKEGIVGGAGLDVLEDEYVLRANKSETLSVEKKKIYDLNQELINMKNVIITPHIGAQSKEAREEMARITVENILSFVSGSPQNLVTT